MWVTNINDVDIEQISVYSFSENIEIINESNKTNSQFFLEECTTECQDLGLSKPHFLM